MATLPKITPEIIQAYKDEVGKQGSGATVKRKEVSIKRFFDWAEGQGHISENPYRPPEIPMGTPAVVTKKKRSVGLKVFATIGLTTALVILLFLLTQKLQIPIPFVKTPAFQGVPESQIQTLQGQRPSGPEATQSATTQQQIPAGSAVIGSWNLYTKLKLTDSSGSPQVGSETVTFKLFNAATGGQPLYTSDPQNITTDSFGSVLISLDRVPTDLFFQNQTLYLEPEIGTNAASARIPVSTASTPSNLGGYFPASPEGATAETVPIIDATGSLNLAGTSPAVNAKAGNFLIQGQTVTIKAADGSGGNIEINPDANGYAHFLFEGNSSNFLNAQAPNLTTGSLYYGMVPNNATGYYLINLQSGAPKMTTKFSVDALGNTNLAGNLATAGTDRLTSAGALENITGYSQNSGNFVINQGAGSFASISKSGTALSDVLTLTLDERGKPATTNTSYSTLTLNRYDGAKEAMALLVKNGNAEFNGQLQLGNFTANPSTAIGTGSLVFNTADSHVYVWNGTIWQQVGGSTLSFSSITSGTNTTAAMVVGTGASLTYSGGVATSGVINANQLLGGTWAIPGTIGSTTPNTGAFTTLTTNGNLVCDAAGNNCPAGSNLWAETLGALYPVNNTVDVLFGATAGATATQSAKFAFTGINTGGTPTASISGTVANVATFIDGNGNISSTNRNNLTLGNSASGYNSTGNILLNPNGTGNVGIGLTSPGNLLGINSGATPSSSQLRITSNGLASLSMLSYAAGNNQIGFDVDWLNGGWVARNSSVYWLSETPNGLGIMGSSGNTIGAAATQNSLVTVQPGGNFGIGTTAPTAKLDVAGNASVSGTLAFHAGTGTIQSTTFSPLVIGGNTTGNITLSPSNDVSAGFVAPNVTNVSDLGLASKIWRNIYGTTIFQGVNQVCDFSGLGCPASFGVNFWQLNSLVVSPSISSYDVTVGGTATGSAFQAFGDPTVGGDILKLNSTVITTGNVFEATSSAVTTGNLIKLGQGGNAAFSGNGILMNFDNTGGGGGTFTGDFLKFTNGDPAVAANTKFVVDSSGNVNVNGGTIQTASANLNLQPAGSGTTANVQVGSGVASTTPDLLVLDLKSTAGDPAGTNGAMYYNASANKLRCFQNGAWADCGTGGGGATTWTLDSTNGVLYPVSQTVDVLIGGTATGSAKFNFIGVDGGLPTASISGNIANVATFLTGNGNLATTNAQDLTLGGSFTGNVILNSRGTAALTANGANLTSPGNLALNGGNLTSTATTFNFDIGNTGTLNFRDGTNTLVAISDQGTTGRLAVTDALQVGLLSPTTAYTRFATSNATVTLQGANLSTAQDVLIGGNFEVLGTLFLDGDLITNTKGTSAIALCTGGSNVGGTCNATSALENTLAAGSWIVNNLTNVGEPALVVNNQKGGDLFDASASGTLRFQIQNNGTTVITTTNLATVASLQVNDSSGTGLGKIDAGTVDPPYTINGSKYATYLPGMVGVKEEVTGTAQTSEYIAGVGYRNVIDFNSLPVGSDLWLFGKTTNIINNIGGLVALLTPSAPTKTWYQVDQENKRLIIYSAAPSEISFRLSAPRFDSASWGNSRDANNPSVGFVINSPDNPVTYSENINPVKLSDFIVSKTGDGTYILQDAAGTVIDGFESIGNFVATNIKVGMVDSQLLIANSIQAASATINNQLFSPLIATKLISPVPDGTDINIQVGTATQSGKLAIKDATGSQVAGIDSSGNATFSGIVNSSLLIANSENVNQSTINNLAINNNSTVSGTLYANNIKSKSLDQIEALLSQVQIDQNLLSQAQSWSIATTSANISNLTASNLYVTGQAAINSLSVTKTLTIGTDLVFQSTINNQQSAIENSIDSLSAPLRIQSLAMAPVELMAGLVKIDTKGNVQISGDLNVAGRIKSSGLTLRDVQGTTLYMSGATSSANLLSLQDQSGTQVAEVNSSGSAQFNSISTPQLVVAAPDATSAGTIINGVVTTNSTIGMATIPAGTSEITIQNPKITDYTLVYVTPTSTTENNVLYVKSKQAGQFVVGFTNLVSVDVSFNWWIVQIQN